MKKLTCLLLCIVMMLGCVVITSATETNPFGDVQKGAWYYDAVLYCYDNNVFVGTTDTTFEPNTVMSRAMLAMTIANVEGADIDGYTPAFTDTPADAWYTRAVAWAADKEIVAGIGMDMFAPDASLTREQMAAILYRYAMYKGMDTACTDERFSSFDDKDTVSSWAVEAMTWLTDRGFINGTGVDGALVLSPMGTSTRAQAAQVLMLFLKANPAPEPDPEDPFPPDYPDPDPDDPDPDNPDPDNPDPDQPKPDDPDPEPPAKVEIGSDRQLLVDDYVVDTAASTAQLKKTPLVKVEEVFTFDKAYERGDTVYHNITQLPDGSYRMYYKATSDIRRICYIESTDGGKTWTRPKLTTNTTFGRSNIVTRDENRPDNLFVFYDTNPNCPESQRWKGIYGQWGDGLFLEYSTDGNYFPFWPNEAQMMSTPQATGGCFFDTLNTVYWDANRGQYVAFVRGFHYRNNYNLTADQMHELGVLPVRDIRVSFSDDCLHWSTPVPLTYTNGEDMQMYHNAIMPYYRTNDLYFGLPTRLTQYTYDNGEYLEVYNYTDIFFMTSRDLYTWNRTDDPYMTPESGEAMWEYVDSGFMGLGYIQTSDTELSFFMKGFDQSKDCTVLYRYVIRIDGFGSAAADAEGAQLVTKPIIFDGTSMEMNYTGEVKVTVTDTEGNSVTSNIMSGDEITGLPTFDGDLSAFAGKEVTLTFDMKDAELYSFKFN